MELKEMIAELQDARHFVKTTSRSYDLITAAAEALALVAWAEEQGATVRQIDADWVCILMDGSMHAKSFLEDTLLGAIRAAKEAYEKEK